MEDPNVDDADVAAMFDLTQKKKKKKKKVVDAEEGNDKASSSSSTDPLVDPQGPPTYTYKQLLQRVTDLLVQNNPELTDRRRPTMKPPQLMKVGTKKTVWSNFQEICKTLNRSPDHVFQFMMAELGTEGSIDGSERLVIKGKFVPKYIESLLRKYVGEYVTCQMCRSLSTTLTKDSVSRLHFNHCQDCGSSRSVNAIRAGFHAQTRADRKALRNA